MTKLGNLLITNTKLLLIALFLVIHTISVAHATNNYEDRLEIKTDLSIGTNSTKWIPLPIRTGEQTAAGFPGGEGMQQIYDLVYSPSNPDVVYMGTDTSQVWKSTDGGRSWMWSGWGFNAHGARSIVVDPDDTNRVWAAGFFGGDKRNALRGVFFSENGGKHWMLLQKMGFFKGSSRGKMLALIEENGVKKLFASPKGGKLFVSADNGQKWSELKYDFIDIHDLEPDPCRAGHLYVACEKGLFLIAPGSNTPIRIGFGLPHRPLSISASRDPRGIIFAALGKDGIYKSENYGNSFRRLSMGRFLVGSFNEVTVSPANGKIAYTMPHLSKLYQGIFVTIDGGDNWTKIGNRSKKINRRHFIQYKLGQWRHGPIAAHPENEQTALIGVNGNDTVVRTDDSGKTWGYSNHGYRGGRMRDMTFLNHETFIIALTDFGLWLTSDAGQSFSHLDTGRMFGSMSSYSVNASYKQMDEKGFNILASLGSWSKKAVILSEDSGRTWKRFKEQSGVHNFSAFHNKDSKTLYSGNYISWDKGISWKKSPNEIRAVFPENNDIVFALNKTHLGIECRRSTDRGKNWQTVGTVIKNTHVTDIAVHPTNPDRIWLASNRGVLILKANQWIRRDQKNGLTADSHGLVIIQCIAVDPKNPSVVYAGRRGVAIGPSNGIFRSMDGGMSWQNFSGNLPDVIDVWSIKISPFSDRCLFIGTSLGTYKMCKDDL
jgi:photosystem II stability/assembly factor-like uncharacterized protein